MSNHNRFTVLEVKLLIVTKFDPLCRNFWIFGNPEIFYSFTFCTPYFLTSWMIRFSSSSTPYLLTSWMIRFSSSSTPYLLTSWMIRFPRSLSNLPMSI